MHMSACHDHERCKNGRTNRDVTGEADFRGLKEPCIALGGVHVGAIWRIQLNDPCFEAMLDLMLILMLLDVACFSNVPQMHSLS